MKKSHAVVALKAGERIRVINRRFSSVPMVYEFSAAPSEGEVLSGEVEIRVKKTLFSRPTQVLALQRNNVIKASMWDTFVEVFVTAGYDMQLTIPKRQMGASRLVVWLLLLVIIAAAAAMMVLPR